MTNIKLFSIRKDKIRKMFSSHFIGISTERTRFYTLGKRTRPLKETDPFLVRKGQVLWEKKTHRFGKILYIRLKKKVDAIIEYSGLK